MAHGKAVKKEDVAIIKKWLEKGLSITDVCEITDRSKDTVRKVKTGGYDYLLNKLEKYETPEMKIYSDPASDDINGKLDEILDVLNVIAERLPE